MSIIIAHLEEVHLYEGSVFDHAGAYLKDSGLPNDIPENVRTYFDTHAFARDMVLSGDVYEIKFDGRRFVA